MDLQTPRSKLATVISYSPLATFTPLLFYKPLPFLAKNVPSTIFWRINRTSIPIPFVKWGRSSYDYSKRFISHICYYK